MKELGKSNITEKNTTKSKKQSLKNKMQKIKKEQGITLIVLVITIIIIIILATVAINFAFGDNGLINKAEQAKDFYSNDTKYTEESMINAESYLNSILPGTGSSGEGGEIPGGSEAVEQGAISFTNPIWANEKASVTISTNTNYTMQYQVVAKEEASNDSNWQVVPEGGLIGNLNHRDVVYARLIQGTNYGEEASTTVKDENAPQAATVKLSSTNVTTGTNVTATVTHIDNESGPNIAQCKYIWNTSNAKLGTDASLYTGRTFSSNGQQIGRTISTEGTWYLHVLTVDNAGNETETISNAVTAETPGIPIESTLKAGDYVTYPSAQGNLECSVLYDSSSGYGVQLITSTCPKDVTLGSSTFSTARNLYNDAITTLNNEANNVYNNSTYSTRARCVGSHPTSTTDNPGYFTSSESYMTSYNGQFKNTDTNYVTDFNQMGLLGIRKIYDEYWLASRIVTSPSTRTDFRVRRVLANDGLGNADLCGVFTDGNPYGSTNTFGLRPVFLLKSNIKVTGGTGEEGSPYTLGT